jgi:flavorubredoxin/NADPH-dependent 2,4-dienoyl-CoA reductase/sulfur reductase-like enzyme
MALELKPNLYWVGALDPQLRIFDIVMTTPYGTSYNSYLLRGSKATVLFETVKETFWADCERNLAKVLKPGEKIDYFVLNHTEPDHSGSLHKLLDMFPNATVVATQTAHTNLEAICYRKYNKFVVTSPETQAIDIGGYTLRFIIAPFLHWPDTMFTYVPEAKIVVTCDFLGSHYSFDGIIDTGLNPTQQKDYFEGSLQGYYDPIFGPFKPYVLKGLEYLKKIDFDLVCCSHGPVLKNFARKVMNQYEVWSQPSTLEDRVVVAYVAAYGYTRQLAETVTAAINKAGVPAVAYDLVTVPVATALEEIGKCKGLVLGTPTILGDALPQIWQIVTSLNPIIHRDRVAAVFGSYGWSGEGTRNINERLSQIRFRTPLEPLAVRFKPNEQTLAHAAEWGASFARAVKGEVLPEETSRKAVKDKKPRPVAVNDGRLRRWKCIICGEIVISVLPPDICRACGAGYEAFVCLGFAGEARAATGSFAGRIVVIGGGCAAVSAAKAVREASASAQLIVISAEKEHPYYRPSLTHAMAQPHLRKDPSFKLVPDSWYADNHVELLLGAVATAVDAAAHTVEVSIGSDVRTVPYDRLILAVGGKNFVPCPASDMPPVGVFNVRTVSDIDAITEYAAQKKAKTAVVIGGGLAALETAESLVKLGIRPHIVELMPRLLPRNLTEEGSKQYAASLAASGTSLHLGTCVKQFLRDEAGAFTGVALTNGNSISADFVCFGVGTSPETALAKSAGLEIKKGIVVTEKMETNVAGIYACGDCTEFQGRNIPNWTEATAQGRAAGLQAVGATDLEGAVFTRVASPYFLDSFCPIFSIGSVPVEPAQTPAKRISFAAANQFAELFFDSTSKLIGAQIVGSAAKQLQTPISLAIGAAAPIGDAVDIVGPVFY